MTRRRFGATGKLTWGPCPGRIMAAIAQAGTRNPLLLLDELDKMGTDYRETHLQPC